MVIRQGDVFWIDVGEPRGSETGFRRPYVVVQNDAFNASRLSTVVVCAITSNPRRAKAPGNVVLSAGEAGLARESVVNVTQIYAIDRDYFLEPIGAVSAEKLDEILQGIWFLLEPRS
ncbi:MAG: type II toxin-antitoxin system PemK/MazF family toxin [bacterium]|nr:type II toxin-antitoxin system PemK/MazF family toxin [bacterium]